MNRRWFLSVLPALIVPWLPFRTSAAPAPSSEVIYRTTLCDRLREVCEAAGGKIYCSVEQDKDHPGSLIFKR